MGIALSLQIALYTVIQYFIHQGFIIFIVEIFHLWLNLFVGILFKFLWLRWFLNFFQLVCYWYMLLVFAFCILQHSWIHLSVPTGFWWCFKGFLHIISCHLQTDNVTSFANWMPFISFFWLIALAKTFSTKVSKSSESGHSCFRTCSSYNWRYVPFSQHPPFLLLHRLITTILLFCFYVFAVFRFFTYKG
jgi:hypothetical protein